MARPTATPEQTPPRVTIERRSRLSRLGAYGFQTQEPIILAALVTGDPLLLIGRSGTGKTFLLNSISEALGLDHRHYNASLISFDDLVGFPYPDEGRTCVRFLQTPATIWGAESVLIDEISRCKPEHAGFHTYIDDNFHYMDEGERTRGPAFSTYEEAVQWARSVVDECLCDLWTPGTTPGALVSQYKAFGEDPWISPTPPGLPRWSAWDYAETRAHDVCRHQGKLPD